MGNDRVTSRKNARDQMARDQIENAIVYQQIIHKELGPKKRG